MTIAIFSFFGFVYLFLFTIIIHIRRKKIILNKLTRNKEPENEKTEKKNLYEKVKHLYETANISLSFEEFAVVVFMIFSAEILICVYFSVSYFILALIFFISFLLIYIIINVFAMHMKQKKENQLETFLVELAGNLYANPNITVAIGKSLEKTEPPLKDDLQMVLDDCTRGLLVQEALKNMINRNRSNLIEIVLRGIIAANDKGVDLITFLNYQITYIRDKKSLNNYVKILSTGPKYTSYFIMIIPLISMCFILLINKNFISFYLEGIGLIVTIYSIASYTIGFLLINKIINNLNKNIISL